MDIHDQDSKVAQWLLVELLRKKQGLQLGPKDKQFARAIMQESPEARRIVQAADQASAQAYAVDVLTQAKRKIVARSIAAQKSKQQERDEIEM